LSERLARNRYQFRTAPRLPVAEHRVSSTQGRLTITRTAFAVYCVDRGMTSKAAEHSPGDRRNVSRIRAVSRLAHLGCMGLRLPGYEALAAFNAHVHGSCRTLGKQQLYH